MTTDSEFIIPRNISYNPPPYKDVWTRVDPRHGTIHLILKGQGKTVCGIPYDKTTYSTIDWKRQCVQCLKDMPEEEGE